MREDYLSAEQVLAVLDIVQKHDAILIGGQSVNLWAEFYFDADERLAAWRPYTSKDIDFYRNPAAADRLAAVLDGRLRVPVSIDDVTPNAATVIGTLGDKRIEIDFLARVLGVDGRSIERNHVTLEGLEHHTGRPVRILILSPARLPPKSAVQPERSEAPRHHRGRSGTCERRRAAMLYRGPSSQRRLARCSEDSLEPLLRHPRCACR